MLKSFQLFITVAIATTTLLIGTITQASPMPAQGSSVLDSMQTPILYSSHGFQMKRMGKDWHQETKVLPNHELSVTYRPVAGKANKSVFLSVKTQTLPKDITVDAYAKRWMRDYPAYGFEVLGTKDVNQNKAQGMLVDLLHAKNNKQLRQLVFVHNKVAVTVTCGANKDAFATALPECNDMIRSFRWKE